MEHQMLLSVQSPLQYCASQPLDHIKVTALSRYQTRIENLSLQLTRDGGDVSFRYAAAACPGVESMPNLIIVSFTHGGLTALMRRPRGISSSRSVEGFV
jgi:hypothetical protein